MVSESFKRDFVSTDISFIPEDWEVRKLQELAKVTGGKRLPKGKSLSQCDTGHPYIRVSDMEERGVSLQSLMYVPLNVVDVIKRYRVEAGDLYISVAGTLGLVGEVPKELDGANLTENADRISEIQCDGKYLLWVLRSELIQNTIKKEQTSNAQPKLALTRIKDFHIPIPSRCEQQKIASILSSVDEAIEKTESIIKQTEEVKKGLIQQLFTKGIGHKKFKKTEIGEIPDEWDVNTLEEVSHGKGEYGIGASATEYLEGEPRYLRITDIDERGRLSYSDIRGLNEKSYERYLLDEGDIVFARTGNTTGKSYLYRKEDGELVFAGFLIRFRLNKNLVHPSYIANMLQTKFYWNWVKVMSTRSGQPGINSNEYSLFKIPVPPLSEQIKIASTLTSLDEKIENELKFLQVLSELKKGLMQCLLTGKVRVKVDEAEVTQV